MSLMCSTCERDMGPSDNFPGREGVMVYANVLSLIWNDEKSPPEQWVLRYVVAPCSVSLCFRCITDKLSEERQPVLDQVFLAYHVEVSYRRAKISEEGRLFSPEETKSFSLFDAWKDQQKAIPARQCIFCANEVRDGQNPYFMAQVIDKVYCEKQLSGLFSLRNYSWSDLKTGMTSFKICFTCLREYFRPTFQILSHSLGSKIQPDYSGSPKSEFYLTSQFIEALKREKGEEEARELLLKFSQGGEIKLAVDPDSTSKN